MKALVKRKDEKGLWLEEVEKPICAPTEVLIKVLKAGICGTDLHIYKWDDWARKEIKLGTRIGHEFVGLVEEVGSQVSSVKVGTRVIVEGHLTCNRCRNCVSGSPHLCTDTKGIGIHSHGGFAEYVTVPPQNIFPVPAFISDEIAAIFDPIGNAVHASLAFNLIAEDVLITGAGPIGQMCIRIAKHVGARHICITDLNPERLAMAKDLGASCAIRSDKTKLRDVVNLLGMQRGFDVGLEMSGSSEALNSMIEVMYNGGKISLLGLLPDKAPVNWSQVIFKALTLQGIYGRKIFDTWYKLCGMIESGLDLSPVITDRYAFEDFEKGFEKMLEGSCGKVILDWA